MANTFVNPNVDPLSLLPAGAKLLEAPAPAPAPADPLAMLPPGAKLIDAPAPAPKPDNSTWQGDLEAGMLILESILPGLKLAQGVTDVSRGQTLDMMAQDTASQLAEVEAQIAVLQQRGLALVAHPDPVAEADLMAELNPLIDRRNQLTTLGGAMGVEALPGYAAQEQAVGMPKIMDNAPVVADLMAEAAAIPMNPAAERFTQPEGDTTGQQLSAMWDALSDDPTGVVRSLALRAAPASMPTVLAGIFGSLGGPAGSMALASLVGGKTEEGASMAQAITQALAEEGVNVNDPAALQTWVNSNMDRAMGMVIDARKRAVAIGLTEALGAGLTHQIARGGANASRLRRVADVAVGGVADASLEGAGEAAAQYVTTGKVDVGEVGAEIVGGLGMGGVQTAGQMAIQAATAPKPDTPKPDPMDLLPPGAKIVPPAEPAPAQANASQAQVGASQAQANATTPVQPEAPATDTAPAADTSTPEGAPVVSTLEIQPVNKTAESEQAAPETEQAVSAPVSTPTPDTEAEVGASKPRQENTNLDAPAVSAQPELKPGHATPDFATGDLPVANKNQNQRAVTDGDIIATGSWALRSDLVPAKTSRALTNVEREGVDAGAPSAGAIGRIMASAPEYQNEAQAVSWRVGVTNGESLATERVVGVLPDGSTVAVQGGTFAQLVNEQGLTLAASADGKMLGVYDTTGERVGVVLPVKHTDDPAYVASLPEYDPAQRQAPGRQTPPKPKNASAQPSERLDRKAIEAERQVSLAKLTEAETELKRRFAAGETEPVRVELNTPSGKKTTFTFPVTEAAIERAAEVRKQWASKPAANIADASPATPSFRSADTELESDTTDTLDEDVTDEADLTSRSPRGGFTPNMKNVSFTNRLSDFEQAFTDAGMDPAEARLLPPNQQINILARVLKDKFGITFERGEGRKHIKGIEAIQQMLDAYRNLQMMAHVLGLPEKALGLKGLKVTLERFDGSYLGVYRPSDRTIGMPGRSNSFAHEWGHALDHFLSLSEKNFDALLSQYTRAIGLDPTVNMEAAFVNLIYTMFFDQADLANKMLVLETEAAKTVTTKGPTYGQPTKKAIEAREQLERLRSGATRMHIDPTAYLVSSVSYSPSSAGYYGSVHEMLARAFEAYIGHKVEAAGGTSEFITKGDEAYLSDADRRLAMTFPKAGERMAIFAAFDSLFDHLRHDQTLATGTAAERPADTAMRNPADDFLAGANMDKGLFGMIRAELVAVGNAIANLVKHPKKSLKDGSSEIALNMGITKGESESARSYLSRIKTGIGDTLQPFVRSMRGIARRIVNRQPKDAQAFLDYILDRIMTNPGKGQADAQITFEEYRDLTSVSAANRIANKIKTLKLGKGMHGLKLTPEQNTQLRAMLTHMTPEEAKRNGVDPKLIELAGAIRDIMTETYFTADRAGLKMGFIDDTGYMPRIVNVSNVLESAEAFRADAEKLYGVVFDDLVSEWMADSDHQSMIRAAVATSLKVWPTLNPKDGPLGVKIAKLKAAVKKYAAAATKAAENPGDRNASAAAAQAEREFEMHMERLADALRTPYSQSMADDWLTRIQVGTGTAFDTLGPDASFNKPRKLPPAADEIMAAWYEKDPVHSAITYVHSLAARTAYQQAFGVTGGNERMRDVLTRESVRDAIAANPAKYDPDTPSGRLNILKDLTDNSRDNLLQMALFEANAAGADSKDLGFFRTTVENITGRGPNNSTYKWGNRLSAAIYVANFITFLPRTSLTAITEPITVFMRTGSAKALVRTMYNYVREFARGAKSVKELNALAQMIGVVTTPLNDVVLMNRLSGDFGQAVAGNMLVVNFFRANFLTQLTNAQRRAVLSAGMFWMRDLARVATRKANSDPAKAKIARAELADLGISAEVMDEFLIYLASGEGLLDVNEVNTPMGRLFANAAARFVDQTIQNPRRADKPVYASTSFGRVAYALMSFLYAFGQNVHMATVKRMARNYGIWREEGANVLSSAGAAGVRGALTLIGGFGFMYVGQLAATIAREAVFNREQWDDKTDEERQKWLAWLAFSRTGALGPGDVLLNMLTGLRYERDLANGVIGSYPSFFLSNFQNMVKGLPKTELYEGGPGFGLRNSPNTTTAEQTALKSVYRLLVAPAAASMLSAVPAAGPVSAAARYGTMLYATSNSMSADFADAVLGE